MEIVIVDGFDGRSFGSTHPAATRRYGSIGAGFLTCVMHIRL